MPGIYPPNAGANIVGPASGTDNAVVRFDGATGKLIQNSSFIIADGASTITSAQMIDPYVPVDGTMNVTGGLAVSSGISTGVDITTTADDRGLVDSAGTRRFSLGSVNGSNPAYFIGRNADGASAVAVKIGAHNDFTTAGSKLLSVGDNAGTSYAEKAYIGYDGAIVNVGGGATIVGSVGITSGNVTVGIGQAMQASGGSSSITYGNSVLSLYATETVANVRATGLEITTGNGLAVGGVTAAKTTDYVATVADFLIPVDVNTTGDVAITLPAANAAKGQILHIKATALHATRDININRAGADTIVTMGATGATTLQLSPTATYSCATLVSDGTSVWYVTQHTA